VACLSMLENAWSTGSHQALGFHWFKDKGVAPSGNLDLGSS